MRSLSTHLRQSEAHAALPFHPDCPICRHTRVLGDVGNPGVVSLRVQAAMVAGMLVFGTAAPVTPALATEPDQEQDGTAPVTQDGTGDPALNPDFDPGGDSTDLPDDAPPLPETVAPPDPGNDDTAPVEADPSTDPREPVLDPGDGSDEATGSPAPAPSPSPPTEAPVPVSTPQASTPAAPAPAPPAPTPAPSASAAPDAPPAATAPVPAASPAPRSPTAPATKTKPTTRTRTRPAARPKVPGRAHRKQLHHAPPASPPPVPMVGSDPPPVATPVDYSTPHAAVETPPPAPAVRHPAKPGDRNHIVEPGESLWAIAANLLGGDATPARVAREVHRLWTLNRGRIGTGNPDLLRVGTRLVLR